MTNEKLRRAAGIDAGRSIGKALAKHVAKTKRILIDFDVKAFREATGGGVVTPTETLVLAMHKARANFEGMPEPLKVESETWLKDRGYKNDIMGIN